MVQRGELKEGVAAHNLKGSIFQWANENRPISSHRFVDGCQEKEWVHY